MAKAAAKKSRPATQPTEVTNWRDQPWLSVIIAACLIAGMTWFFRNQAHNTLAQRGDYQLQLHELTITLRPAWIRADIRAEALRDARLDPPLSILDEQLVGKLEAAFRMHPWVAKVIGVRKLYPSQVFIELQYREPVAMVKVTEGLLPIDAQGYQLPPRDFDGQLLVNELPRVEGISTQPLSSYGAIWPDPIVQDAARIAVLLKPIWNKSEFVRLRWLNDAPALNQAGRLFVLDTKAGGTVIWGQAPGKELSGEQQAAEKLSAINRYATAEQGLNQQLGINTLDLRYKSANQLK
jgi:hypothetical protein